MITKIKMQFRDGKHFLKFSLVSLFGQAIGALIPFGIAKILNPEGFGIYSLSMIIIFFFVSSLISVSQTPFIVYSNQERQKTGRINKTFSIQLIFLLLSIVLFVIMFVLFKNFILNFIESKDTNLLFFMFLAFVGISLKTFFINIFLCFNKKLLYSVVELFYYSFCAILVLLSYLGGVFSLNFVLLTYFLSALIVIILYLRKVNVSLFFPFIFDKDQFVAIFNFTKWQVFGLVAAYFISWGGSLILKYFVSIEQVGVYSLGYTFFNGFITLTFFINVYFLPFISANINNKKVIKDYLYNKRPKLFLLGSFLLILSGVIIPFGIDLIYGKEYQFAKNVFWILLVGNFVALYNVFYTPLLNSLERFKFYQISNIIHLFLSLILTLFLVPLFGILGAAIATTIAYFAKMAIFEVYFRIKLKKMIE